MSFAYYFQENLMKIPIGSSKNPRPGLDSGTIYSKKTGFKYVTMEIYVYQVTTIMIHLNIYKFLINQKTIYARCLVDVYKNADVSIIMN